MKNRAIYIALLSGLAVMPLSCTQTAAPEGYGYVEIIAVTDSSTDYVDTGAPDGTVPTKAGGEDAIALTIYDAAEEVAYSTDDCSSVTEPIVLKTGTYRAVATSGAGLSGGACFDTPFYSAAKEFTVRRGVVESLELTLTLEAVMVTVEFSQEIQDNFSSYVLTVSNGADGGNALVFRNGADGSVEGIPARESTLDRTGYFAVTGTLTYSLELIAKDGRVFQPLVTTYTDVRPKTHYAFRFGVAEKQQEGAAEITITVDNSMTEKEHDIILDFTLEDIPQITGSFDPAAGLSFYAGDDGTKKLTIDFKKQAVDVEISHDDAGLAAAGLPESTGLVGAAAGTVAALAELGIVTEAVTPEMMAVEVDFTAFFSKLPAGSYSFDIFVRNDAGGELGRTVNVDVMSRVTTVSSNAWARFATLTGTWQTDSRPEGLGFQWRTADGEWAGLDAEITADDAAKTFTADLTGLVPATGYEFRAVCTQEMNTSPVSFTTETEQTLHNMGFDKWYMAGKAPMPNESADYQIWDSANPGSADIMGIFSYIPTRQETEHLYVSGDGKSAARLETLEVPVVGIAAGNIYTGKFGSTIGTSGASLDWGVPFASRPLALKGAYDYAPMTIDKVRDPYTDMEGKTDIGQIQIMLTDWDGPFPVNTSTNTFVDVKNDPHIIAYGSKDLNATGGYETFTVKLDYRDMTRTPKYIVIVAAASKYGDYFTGGVGSVLYVDEFSLVYDPAELAE